jgi:hypothetical protein
LNLDYAFPGAGFNLIHPRDDLAGEFIQRLGMRGGFALENGGFAAVSGFADVGAVDVSGTRRTAWLFFCAHEKNTSRDCSAATNSSCFDYAPMSTHLAAFDGRGRPARTSDGETTIAPCERTV